MQESNDQDPSTWVEAQILHTPMQAHVSNAVTLLEAPQAYNAVATPSSIVQSVRMCRESKNTA